MATVKRIGPKSAFMIGLVTYAILGLIVGAIIACFSLVKGAVHADDHSGSYLALEQSFFFPSYMASVVQSAGGLERQSTTSWLAGSVGSRWTSANPSTIEAVQARKWQRLRTQSQAAFILECANDGILDLPMVQVHADFVADLKFAFWVLGWHARNVP